MRIFEIVKENVNLREAAELYGIDVNRYGKALCSFHNDRHPSLYVADDHYYCFACGEHGDVIDFVGRLFQLRLGARKCICLPPKQRSKAWSEPASTPKAPSSADRIPSPNVGTARNSLSYGARHGQT